MRSRTTEEVAGRPKENRGLRQQHLGPDVTLTCESVEQAAQGGVSPSLTEAAFAALHASCHVREALEASGTPIYGTTTGFGPFVTFASADGGHGREQHGVGLLAHLGAGWGPSSAPWTEEEIVRAAMWIRAQNLAQGYSGITPERISSYLRLPENDIVPCVPPVGSVGASGDLIPLAHIARAVAGQEDARVFYRGNIVSAPVALHAAGLCPLLLTGREALALTNGTSFLTAFAALAVARAERLLFQAERLTGWLYRQLGARTAALDGRLHAARGHRGQQVSACNIYKEAFRCGTFEDETRALQEIYSLRCAPQVLGACRENLDFARRLVETEVNGVSDNPLFFEANDFSALPAVLHGGNFHGQQVAFAADALNAALTQVGVLVERQIAALVTPSATNQHAPLLLAFEPGATSGLAGAQITATALVAEMRSRAQMHATFSLPTNGDNQDVVSMGTLAARAAYEQTERLSAILAVLCLALQQLNFLRSCGRASGRITSPLPGLPEFIPVTTDRPLYTDIQQLGRFFLNVVRPSLEATIHEHEETGAIGRL